MHLLALIEEPGHVCFRYRLAAFDEALARRGWRVDPRALARGGAAFRRQMADAARADAVVLQRRLLPGHRLRRLRAAAKVLIFDVDDAVFHRDSNARRPAHSLRRSARFRATVRAADLVTVGNDYLRRKATAFAEPSRVVRIPTCIRPSDYVPTDHAADRIEDRDGVRLVWIGSHSTLPSLTAARDALAAAHRRVPSLSLTVIADGVPELDGIPIRPRRWSAATEAAELAAADIGVSWLPRHPWSLGKCGLKVIQFMAAGLPVVANPFGVHRRLVRHGETGFLAATAAQWAEAVGRLADSPAMRQRMGQAGRALVESEYSTNAWGPRFAALIDRWTHTP
jgi:glycosyltransferase involved in cell wall biosynthesis